MRERHRRHKFFKNYALEPSGKIIDPQITEQSYELLLRGVPEERVLAAITSSPDPALVKAMNPPPAPKPHKFKLRGPLRKQIPELDAFIAQSLAAGVSVPEMMAQVLPSIQQEREWKAQADRERNAALAAKRDARIAAQNDPEKIEAGRKAFQKRMRRWDRQRKAREKKAELEAQEKAKALAENPSLNWRTPRRKDWAEKNLKK
jgi:hypothetical protein